MKQKTVEILKIIALGIGIILLGITLMSNKPQQYCEGWQEGYVRGWCFDDQFCQEPLVPLCPLPELGFEKYQDGYDRGFLKGKQDRLDN